MSFYAPYLPITRDQTNGYKMLDDLRDVVKQNFRMLILTNPGERVMLPEFGVGLRRFLFEGISNDTFTKLAVRIRQQVRKYMPFLDIEDIQFATGDTDTDLSPNQVNVYIIYNLGQIGNTDEVSISQFLD